MVRRCKEKSHKRRAFKLKNLEDEVGMVNEDETRKKGKKKNVGRQGDFDEFLDDLEADPDLRK